MARNQVHPSRRGKGSGDEIKIRKVDYEAFAKQAGNNAYRIAIQNGLPKKVAKEFQRICGAPVPQECRA